MDIEELKPVLASFKPHLIIEHTGLSRITIYNIMAGTQRNPRPATVEKLMAFLVSQQILIVALQIEQPK